MSSQRSLQIGSTTTTGKGGTEHWGIKRRWPVWQDSSLVADHMTGGRICSTFGVHLQATPQALKELLRESLQGELEEVIGCKPYEPKREQEDLPPRELPAHLGHNRRRDRLPYAPGQGRQLAEEGPQELPAPSRRLRHGRHGVLRDGWIHTEERHHSVDFFGWYNTEHHHSGLGYLTPHDVHYGLAAERTAERATVLAQAYAEHPERFTRGAPKPPAPPKEVWINKPATIQVTEQVAL